MLRLVSNDPPRTSLPTNHSASKPGNGHKEASTVLVVEDEILVRMPVAEFLRDSGYRVIEASGATEAQMVIQSGEPVEVVFSDINLLGEMNGIDLAKWIKRKYPDVIMILTSGVTTVDSREAFFLPKPYTFEALAGHLKKLLGS
jgi:DNA-binding NtrC family response regulator